MIHYYQKKKKKKLLQSSPLPVSNKLYELNEI